MDRAAARPLPALFKLARTEANRLDPFLRIC
jgi:hypothetical protein